MAYELKDGNGSLFRNDRKAMDTHADYTGTVKVGGQEYYLNAWLKEGNNGRFFSLAFKPKTITAHNGDVYERRDVERHARQTKASFRDDLDGDEIPFNAEFR